MNYQISLGLTGEHLERYQTLIKAKGINPNLRQSDLDPILDRSNNPDSRLMGQPRLVPVQTDEEKRIARRDYHRALRAAMTEEEKQAKRDEDNRRARAKTEARRLGRLAIVKARQG